MEIVKCFIGIHVALLDTTNHYDLESEFRIIGSKQTQLITRSLQGCLVGGIGKNTGKEKESRSKK